MTAFDDRAIRSAIQRARPPTLAGGYDRKPADMPADPIAAAPSWRAKIIDGTNEGKPYLWSTYTYFGYQAGYEWYVDEVDPLTGNAFYPSRTRDAENNWIETTVINNPMSCWFQPWFFWPIPVDYLLDVRLADHSHRLDHGLTNPYNVTWVPPVGAMGTIAATMPHGVATRVEWEHYIPSGVYAGVWYDYIYGPSWYQTDGCAYPRAKIGDTIFLLPVTAGHGDGISWVDATSRILMPNVSRGTIYPPYSVREINVDSGGHNGHGILWSKDLDTDT